MDTHEQIASMYLQKAREAEEQAQQLRKQAMHAFYDWAIYLEAARKADARAKLYRKCARLAWYF